MGCRVQAKSVRARPGSMVSINPKAHGINWNKTSAATPALVHSHNIALAVVANIASGTGRSGLAFFHCIYMTIIATAQNQEPTTSKVAPM